MKIARVAGRKGMPARQRIGNGLVLVLVALAACGEAPERTATRLEARAPGDDKTLAFTVLPASNTDSTNSDVYVSRSDGSGARPFLSSPTAEFYPEWSPDGGRLAFVSDLEEPGNVDVYVIDSDGTNLRRVTDHPAIDTAPAWSPDGMSIALSRNISGQDELVVTSVQGGTETQLTDNDFIDASPDFSPTGDEIAFVRNTDGQVDIWVIGLAGGNAVRLTNDDAAEGAVAWSPDGKRLAATRSVGEDGGTDVILIDRTQGSIEPVTHSAMAESYVEWSPDGRRIIFSSRPDPMSPNARAPAVLRVFDLETGRQRPLQSFPRGLLMPSWRR
jgi:Tol biopolymer transport system component